MPTEPQNFDSVNLYRNDQGYMSGFSQRRARIERPESPCPPRIQGRLLDLSVEEAVRIGLSNEDWKVGYKAWRYNLRLLDKEGNFEAILDKRP